MSITSMLSTAGDVSCCVHVHTSTRHFGEDNVQVNPHFLIARRVNKQFRSCLRTLHTLTRATSVDRKKLSSEAKSKNIMTPATRDTAHEATQPRSTCGTRECFLSEVVQGLGVCIKPPEPREKVTGSRHFGDVLNSTTPSPS